MEELKERKQQNHCREETNGNEGESNKYKEAEKAL